MRHTINELRPIALPNPGETAVDCLVVPQSSQSWIDAQRATVRPVQPDDPDEPRFLHAVANAVRIRWVYRTGPSTFSWVDGCVLFHTKRHARDRRPVEVSAFLTDLADHRTVSASTPNQALNAIVFISREVMRRDPGEFGEFDRTQRR